MVWRMGYGEWGLCLGICVADVGGRIGRAEVEVRRCGEGRGRELRAFREGQGVWGDG